MPTSSYPLKSKFQFASLLLLLVGAASVSARPHASTNATTSTAGRIMARKNMKTVPALACSAAVPFECSTGSYDFCCPDRSKCVDPTDLFNDAGAASGGWGCRFSCGVSETPCDNGRSCCPDDLQCGKDGQCVPKDDAPGDQHPVVCDRSESLCFNACCMVDEICDKVRKTCRAPGVGDPTPDTPDDDDFDQGPPPLPSGLSSPPPDPSDNTEGASGLVSSHDGQSVFPLFGAGERARGSVSWSSFVIAVFAVVLGAAHSG